MFQWSDEEIKKAVDAVNRRADTDRAFRNLLLKDPCKAIEQEFGHRPPKEINIQFIENSRMKKTFVLNEFSGDELNDDDLEQVAGGRSDCPRLESCRLYH